MLKYSAAPKLGRTKFGISMESFSPAPAPPGPAPDLYFLNTTHGILCGGRGVSPTSPSNLYERSTYSTEVNATNAATLSQARLLYHQSCGNATKIYSAGGDSNTNGGGAYQNVDIYTYSSNTSAAGTNITAALRYRSGGGGNNTVGFIHGGRNAGNTADVLTTDKITYSTDGTSVGPSLTSGASDEPRSAGNNTKLYIFLGNSSCDKLSHSTDTIANQAGVLNVARKYSSTRITTTMDFIYLLGGSGGNTSATKFTISTETAAAITGLTFTHLIVEGVASGNATKIYSTGGYDTDFSKRCQAVTLSNDTPSVITAMNSIGMTIWAGGG